MHDRPATAYQTQPCMEQDVAAALECLAKDVVMAVAFVPRVLEAQPLGVRTEPAPLQVCVANLDATPAHGT